MPIHLLLLSCIIGLRKHKKYRLKGAFTPEYFSHFSSDIVPKCRVHTKKIGTKMSSWEPFYPLLESKRFLFLIGWADCKPRPVKLPKGFVKPPFYYPRISIISISISPAHKRRETNLWQHKIKHGSGGDEEVSAFWRFTRKASVEAVGSPSSFYWSQSPTPGTSGGSIRREVVCGLPVNPKQKKKKWRQWLHLPNPPSGTYSSVNAICT